MQVTLTKNVTVDNIELKKGEQGWMRGIRFGGDHDLFICDFGEHKMVYVEHAAISFPKREVKIIE